MGRTWTTWTDEEKDDLATRIILAMADGKSSKVGIQSFLEGFPHQQRTLGTCYWKWNNELSKDEKYIEEMDRLGVTMPSRRSRKSKRRQDEVIQRVYEEAQKAPEIIEPIYHTVDDTQLSEFFSVFENMVGHMKGIYNEYIRLRNENEALRGQILVRDEALAKATDELQTFIKAFQIARPNAFRDIIPVRDLTTKVNNRGEVDKVEFTG